MEANAARAAHFLRALANEHRLLVLCALTAGEMTVGALQGRIGLGQSALSQHLAVLRSEGLVATRREGQSIHYRIGDPATLKIMSTLAEIFCPAEEPEPC
jgi:ArsR family transcriptional regulator, virulence genes transcriptional regulator